MSSLSVWRLAGPFTVGLGDLDMTTKLPETMCGLGIRRGGDDLPEITDDDIVIVVKDVYATVGQPTTSGSLKKSDPKYKDTRKLAVSPGRFTWLNLGEHKGQHSSGRKVGIQLLVMLSSPVNAPKTASEKKHATAMSEMI